MVKCVNCGINIVHQLFHGSFNCSHIYAERKSLSVTWLNGKITYVRLGVKIEHVGRRFSFSIECAITMVKWIFVYTFMVLELPILINITAQRLEQLTAVFEQLTGRFKQLTHLNAFLHSLDKISKRLCKCKTKNIIKQRK